MQLTQTLKSRRFFYVMLFNILYINFFLGNDIGALPYTVFIDRNGIISFTHRGPLLKSDVEKVVQTLL